MAQALRGGAVRKAHLLQELLVHAAEVHDGVARLRAVKRGRRVVQIQPHVGAGGPGSRTGQPPSDVHFGRHAKVQLLRLLRRLSRPACGLRPADPGVLPRRRLQGFQRAGARLVSRACSSLAGKGACVPCLLAAPSSPLAHMQTARIPHPIHAEAHLGPVGLLAFGEPSRRPPPARPSMPDRHGWVLLHVVVVVLQQLPPSFLPPRSTSSLRG